MGFWYRTHWNAGQTYDNLNARDNHECCVGPILNNPVISTESESEAIGKLDHHGLDIEHWRRMSVPEEVLEYENTCKSLDGEIPYEYVSECCLKIGLLMTYYEHPLYRARLEISIKNNWSRKLTHQRLLL